MGQCARELTNLRHAEHAWVDQARLEEAWQKLTWDSRSIRRFAWEFNQLMTKRLGTQSEPSTGDVRLIIQAAKVMCSCARLVCAVHRMFVDFPICLARPSCACNHHRPSTTQRILLSPTGGNRDHASCSEQNPSPLRRQRHPTEELTHQVRSPVSLLESGVKRFTDKASGSPSTMTWERKRPEWRPVKRCKTAR